MKITTLFEFYSFVPSLFIWAFFLLSFIHLFFNLVNSLICLSMYVLFIYIYKKKLWIVGLLESMLIYCICTQYLVGALITASIRRGMEVISLWHCWCGMEAHVSLTVSFSSSAFVSLLFLIFLLTILHRFSMFRSGEFTGQSSTPTHGHLTNFWCFWQCGQVPNPAGKWNQHI